MKNKKKVKIILIIITALLVLAGVMFGIFSIVNKAENERKDRIKREKEISSNFDEFKENALYFGEIAVDYKDWIKDDISKDTIAGYDGWVLSLDSMQTALTNMDKVSDMYKKNCINKHYSKESIQTMCTSFIDAYEEAVNTFVSYVTDFNEKINEIKESVDNEEIKEYELKYKKIDLNKDNNYKEIEFEEETEEE